MRNRQKSGFRAKIGALQYNNFNAGTTEGSSTTASIHNQGIGVVLSKDLISPTIGMGNSLYDSSLSLEAGLGLITGKELIRAQSNRKEDFNEERTSGKFSLLYRIFFGKGVTAEFENGVHTQGTLVNEFFNRFGIRNDRDGYYLGAKFCIPGYQRVFHAQEKSKFEVCSLKSRLNMGNGWILKFFGNTVNDDIKKTAMSMCPKADVTTNLEILVGRSFVPECFSSPIECFVGLTGRESSSIDGFNFKSLKNRFNSKNISIGLKAEASTKIDTKNFPLVKQVKIGMTYIEDDVKKVKECGDNKKLDLSATANFGADSMLSGIFPHIGVNISPTTESGQTCNTKLVCGLSSEFF